MVDPKDIPDELIDALLANLQKPDDLLGKNGILYFSGRGVQANINAGLKNRALKKDAYKSSGIFVEVADVDTPVLQIRYSSSPKTPGLACR